MGRRVDQHIDDRELNALVPWPSETGAGQKELSEEAVLEAERHVQSCADCSHRVLRYGLMVNRLSSSVVSEAEPAGTGCPNDEDVDWSEVAAWRWPELRAKQLIMHAAICAHCGPLLRAAVYANNAAVAKQGEGAVSTAPSQACGEAIAASAMPPPFWLRVLDWKAFVPALALVVIAGVLGARVWSRPLTGPRFAEFAVRTHQQHAQGRLALDVHTDSQQRLNEWFKGKLGFSLALPASAMIPGEERPNRLEGARLVPLGGKTAVFIAYQMPKASTHEAVSLIVTPDSVAVASGALEVDFKKVSFHYGMVDGVKVVTWSLHGLTYALVSEEGNSTQRSCMVCHSAMRDRDLSQAPSPLDARKNSLQPTWQ